MKFSIINTERTNNFKDSKCKSKIQSLWAKSYEDIKNVMANGKVIACVYHSYESDYKGDYSVSICDENEENGNFDTSNYSWKEYKVEDNDPNEIIKTWEKIWKDEENHIINRKYSFDYEKYSSTDTPSIFVAVK